MNYQINWVEYMEGVGAQTWSSALTVAIFPLPWTAPIGTRVSTASQIGLMD